MQHAIAVLIALMQPADLAGEFVSLFTPCEYSSNSGSHQGEVFRYRLFEPLGASCEKKYPLILWLHGHGEAGDDNVLHLRWLDHLVICPPWQRERYPFFLLAVQCPLENALWTRPNSPAGDDDMIEIAKDILKQTLDAYYVDRDRVYLVGLSSGGEGCWELAKRYPDYFAAVAPLASAGGDRSHVSRLINIPVWAFNSIRDNGAPIGNVRRTVEALRSVGGKVHLTEYDSHEHDCWTAAFGSYYLLDWMLAQRRGHALSAPTPGTVSLRARLHALQSNWQWWQLLVQVGIPAILVIVVWRVIKQRRVA